MVFQTIINKRGRPKISREGRKDQGKKRNTERKKSNFLDEIDSIFPKKSQNPDKTRQYVRGPYKKKDSVNSSNSNLSNVSSQSYKRGPYKKREKGNKENRSPNKPKNKKSKKTTEDWMDSASAEDVSVPDTAEHSKETNPGPRRAPHTMKALRKDYPEVVGRSPTESCYTCEFPLDRLTRETGERVVRCNVCNEADVHESCLKNCRICDERDL